jgi:hypothetical protein
MHLLAGETPQRKDHAVNAILRLLIAAVIGFAPAAASANASAGETSCNDHCGDTADWFDLNAIALKVSYPGTPGYALWRSRFDSESRDFRLDAEMSNGKVTRTGTILMVNGLVMAVRGQAVNPGHELDLLDGAALSQQLVYRLLNEALPQGPGALKGVRKVDYASESTDLHLATPSSEGIVSAPWRVTGTVKRLAGNAVEYDLKLTSGGASNIADNANTYNPHVSGRLSKLAAAKLDDSTSLKGWKTYSVGAELASNDEAAPGADRIHSSSETYRSIADVRRKLADDGPGSPDTSKDFTGFWKEQCDNDFGLRIARKDEHSKYVIAFCGPGGCEDLDRARRSFITGDDNYEIIGDDDMIQTGQQGGRQRYHRCEAADK